MSIKKGLYGKLPGHGDFIQRELPASFVKVWDEWLQRAVYGSRELVGESWLDYYLTSPIWRFALSSGVLDGQAWAGILVPSVDSVGRYFPLTMAVPVTSNTNPFSVQVTAESWYQQMSDLALEALQGGLQADHLLERFPDFLPGLPDNRVIDVNGSHIVACNEANIGSSYPSLLNQLYRANLSSFSLWWCAGSQQLAPTTLVSPALPEPTLYCSMLGAPSQNW
ncbi:type VI secretion system protein ImpM [Microbulbifer donghaiensis]|uniref:Type VI secretion system protein ImpM n=1 Tax=Microbulbifer donghaiensis TaxID=494016 RepID=A0A1M5EFL2_9GAMM|nr:type VI secretion system-associated protein TagF [Microbulbifer donghaiensis]SHF77976.1 type VI secretion system protein ImpM [Microbulbifer donghaiensis]